MNCTCLLKIWRDNNVLSISTFTENIELVFIKTEASLNNGSCHCAACVKVNGLVQNTEMKYLPTSTKEEKISSLSLCKTTYVCSLHRLPYVEAWV